LFFAFLMGLNGVIYGWSLFKTNYMASAIKQ
jgi:hypothetical protein